MNAVTKLVPRLRRLNVADAKARLSEVLRTAEAGPTIIHNRGRDVAVVLDIATFDRLTAAAAETRVSAFLHDAAELRRTLGGGGEFVPAKLAFKLRDPFARRQPSGRR